MGLLQQPIFIVLAVALGLAVFLFAAGPALVRGRLDLVDRLRRLDPDAWLDEDQAQPSTPLAPVAEDAWRALRWGGAHLGLIAPRDLPRLLRRADMGLSVREFYQDKIVTALGLEAVLLIMNVSFERLGLLHVGIWPAWIWVCVGLCGFVWPDLVVKRGASERQQKLRAELPRLVDMLVVASSTGRGVQDAILDVEPVLSGPLAKEWSRMTSQLSLGLATPLRELATRGGLRELDVLVGHLIAAYERGQGLETNLVQLSET
jgi:pilus assembly protein TadC